MTALADVLGARVPPGAYRWPAAYDAERVSRVVERAGVRHAHLRGAGLRDRADLVAALGRALDLTGLHGHNLDALEEQLRTRRGPTVVQWSDWQPLARSAPQVVRIALDVLTSDPRAPTWVLLRGPAASPDLGAAAGLLG